MAGRVSRGRVRLVRVKSASLQRAVASSVSRLPLPAGVTLCPSDPPRNPIATETFLTFPNRLTLTMMTMMTMVLPWVCELLKIFVLLYGSE